MTSANELRDLNNIYLTEISADTALAASKAADKKRSQLASAGDKEGAVKKMKQASRLYKASGEKRKKEPVAIADRSYPKGKGADYKEDKDWGYDKDGNSLNPVDIEKKKRKDDDLAGSPNKVKKEALEHYRSLIAEKEVKVKDTRRTVDAIRAYDKSKDASRDADWDTEHGEKEKGDIEKKYAKKERGEIDKDDPNWKKRKYHTGIHGEEVEALKRLVESGKFSDEEIENMAWDVYEGYQRNPEEGERKERAAAKKREAIPGQASRGMPPRGDKKREEFEKWYAANVR